jgi:hypothetical protein
MFLDTPAALIERFPQDPVTVCLVFTWRTETTRSAT